MIFMIYQASSSDSVNASLKGVTAHVNININDTNKSHCSFQVSSGYIIHGSLLILFIFRRCFCFLVSGESSSDEELALSPNRPQQKNYGSSSSPWVPYL